MSNNTGANNTNVRVTLFVLTWINTFAANQGWYHLPVVNEEMVAILLTAVASVWALYKNNNFTKESKIAQKKLDTLKENKVK
jgi:SPP1 family holin